MWKPVLLDTVNEIELFTDVSTIPSRPLTGLDELFKDPGKPSCDRDRLRPKLFGDLQRSNLELIQSYDTTLEGWAKALELKDQETEGHARRVIEMTMALADKLGIEDKHLAHIRRGALLHDIGKMGIPDQVLQKEGPLNEEKWELMKQHPQYAYDLLSEITYLKPALDIPY